MKAFLFAILYLIAVVFLVPERWVVGVVGRDRDAYAEVIPAWRDSIDVMTKRWYAALFIRSGAVHASFAIYTPERENVAADPARSAELGQWPLDWWQRRLAVFWTVVYMATQRMVITVHWLPWIAVAALPWLADGWALRAVRRYGFALASPVRQRIALYAITTLALIYAVTFLIPVAWPVWWPPICGFIVILAMRTAMVHYLKRV